MFFYEIHIFVTMKTRREYLTDIFVELGLRIADFGRSDNDMRIIDMATAANGWFTRNSITQAVGQIRSRMLSEEALTQWLSAYPVTQRQCNVGLITAGNIPLVGFFDMLCILISDHKLFYKPSSKDIVMTEFILNILRDIDPSLPIYPLGEETDPDAIIATGSDNTNRYFRSRYGNIPSIFRGSRSSVAILDGKETKTQLDSLAYDIFSYSGLGCRNVSHLILPEGYDFSQLEASLSGYDDINPKYMNNYRQRAAMLKTENKQFINGGFYILREQDDFPAYISEITWHISHDNTETQKWLETHDSQIQCIVGMTSHPRGVDFGCSQSPALNDYPDAADVMDFLTHI